MASNKSSSSVAPFASLGNTGFNKSLNILQKRRNLFSAHAPRNKNDPKPDSGVAETHVFEQRVGHEDHEAVSPAGSEANCNK
jgi:hypothetical protein